MAEKACMPADIVPDSSNSQPINPSQMDPSALNNNPQWAAYKASLDKNGFFKGNIPGSAQYKQLLSEAVQSFAQNEAYQQAAEAAAAPAEAIFALLQQPTKSEQFQVCCEVQ